MRKHCLPRFGLGQKHCASRSAQDEMHAGWQRPDKLLFLLASAPARRSRFGGVSKRIDAGQRTDIRQVMQAAVWCSTEANDDRE